MDAAQSPTISSFVIRFVVEPAGSVFQPQPYHASIRHVQSDEAINFTTWQDAVEFIQRYVPLESEATSPANNSPANESPANESPANNSPKTA